MDPIAEVFKALVYVAAAIGNPHFRKEFFFIRIKGLRTEDVVSYCLAT